MQIIGTWNGVLVIDKLKEYIEDEIFQIEIRSVDAQNAIKAVVKAETQTAELDHGGKGKPEEYPAEGTFDPQSGKLLLYYTVKSAGGSPVSVELSGVADADGGTIEGQYRILSRPQPVASFKLRKAEKEPL